MPRLIEYAQSIANEDDPVVQPPTPLPEPRIIDVVDDLPKHATKTYETRPVSDITVGVLHHSGPPTTHNTSVEAIARWHVKDPPNGRGWPGITYTYYIVAAGEIYQTNRYDVITYHAHSPTNEKSIAICLAGDLRPEGVGPPTDAQVASCKWLIAKIDADIGPLNWITHGDAPNNSTECPGSYSDWIEDVIPSQDDELDIDALRAGLKSIEQSAKDAKDHAHTAKVQAGFAEEKARELLKSLP